MLQKTLSVLTFCFTVGHTVKRCTQPVEGENNGGDANDGFGAYDSAPAPVDDGAQGNWGGDDGGAAW